MNLDSIKTNKDQMTEARLFASADPIPDEIGSKILSYLNLKELSNCRLVNREWKRLASDGVLQKDAILREIAFGKEQWERYFGDIGEEPALPANIYEILKSPCPIIDGKKVGETHMLVLIPETVNGKPLTLNYLGELVKSPKQGNATGYYNFIWDKIIKKHWDMPNEKSHWVLMTKDVLPGSECMGYKAHLKLVLNLRQKAQADYQVPKALDAATCIFMKCVSSGERLYSKKQSCPYTRCQENVESEYLVRRWANRETDQLVVGSFGPNGLRVGDDGDRVGYIGVAALWKFF